MDRHSRATEDEEGAEACREQVSELDADNMIQFFFDSAFTVGEE